MKILGMLFTLLGCAAAHGETIAVIGTGRVAGALGAEWGERGHTIIYGSRDPARPEVAELVKRSGASARATTPAEAVRNASVVVFAVRWEGAEASAKSLGDLKGKILIDPTNPLDFEGDELVHVPVIGSGAEQIARWLPGARIVKAFNTLNYRVMADPKVGGGPVSIPLASDDEAAKARVAGLVRELGLDSHDMGPLSNSRYLEGMAMLYVDAQMRGKGFEYHLRPR